jgi:O2-independent ubiquinone biosynthesis accessory factor UbiT
MRDLLLFPLQAILQQIVSGVARRQSAVFERLGPHCHSTYLIDPVNLPIVLILKPDRTNPQLRAAWRGKAGATDCRIAGRLQTLLALVDGRGDGDASFFSRDLTVEGNIDAVVTLRNALDDLDVTLVQDIVSSSGPLRGPLEAILRIFRGNTIQETRRAG